MRRPSRLAALGLVALSGALLAKRAPADDASQAAAATVPSASGASAGSAAPASSTDSAAAEAAKEQNRSLTGYGYHDPAPRKGGATSSAPVHHHRAVPAGPIATLPGFEMQADGSSRFFVQLTQSVNVEEKKAAGSVTYVLKGAHVAVRNNENALVTVHFNTPVTRARLVPMTGGLGFVIELRANVAPAYKMVAGKDGSSILEVDFPKGSYIPGADPVAPDAAKTSDAGKTTDPKR